MEPFGETDDWRLDMRKDIPHVKVDMDMYLLVDDWVLTAVAPFLGVASTN